MGKLGPTSLVQNPLLMLLKCSATVFCSLSCSKVHKPASTTALARIGADCTVSVSSCVPQLHTTLLVQRGKAQNVHLVWLCALRPVLFDEPFACECDGCASSCCPPQSHTILLVQPGKPETRTYSDYESVNECMEGVCHIYEEHLKRQNPNTPSITYDISQLFDFVDQLVDLSCLVYQKSTNTYAPYNKAWIKEKIYILLRRQASKSQS